MVLDRLIALHVLTINHNYCVPWLVQQLAGKGGGAGGDMTPQKSDDVMDRGYRCFDKYQNMFLFRDMLVSLLVDPHSNLFPLQPDEHYYEPRKLTTAAHGRADLPGHPRVLPSVR